VDLPDEEYAELRIIDPNLLPEIETGKRSVLDIKLKTVSGKLFDIEIQVNDTHEMRERIAVYAGKMLGGQGGGGENYRQTGRVICVLITGFCLLEETSSYYSCFRLRNEDASVTLTKVMEIHTLELPKIPRAEDGNKVWRWLKFLNSTKKEEFDMLQRQYPELQKPVARLMELSADEETRLLAEAREKAERDYAAGMHWSRQEGRQEGLTEGLTEGKREVARSMLQRGMPVELVMELTGLTRDEIERLRLQ
jgi:predicted transposase/invertase (TIGR01784 family)